jgi:hypothetical protein
MVDLENCNGEHIIETLFYPAYVLNFYIPIKDKIFIPIWNNDVLKTH